MKVFLDTVRGHEIDSSIGVGRILRTALVTEIPLGLVPDPTTLIRATQFQGMPQKGDAYPHPDFSQYFLKRYILRPGSATQCFITMIYEFRGILTINDGSSLANVPTQLHPSNFAPLYVYYTAPGGTKIPKQLTLNTTLPLRHLIFTKTVDFQASPNVLDAFGCVNDSPWQGYPLGYWLFSGIEGETVDDGITYTYSATFTSKVKEDWSQIGFMSDDTGQAVFVNPTDVSTLRNKPYEYSQDTSVNGVLKVGMFDLRNFGAIFGV